MYSTTLETKIKLKLELMIVLSGRDDELLYGLGGFCNKKQIILNVFDKFSATSVNYLLT